MPRSEDRRKLVGFEPALWDLREDAFLNQLALDVAEIARTPIALLSLMSSRIQLFRVAHGLPEDLRLCRATNRCDSFCQFAVVSEPTFVVPDAMLDDRVPRILIERYGLRAYLGVPVRVFGEVIGSLCAVDTQPRQFEPETIADLSRKGVDASQRLEEIVREATASRPPESIQLNEAVERLRGLRVTLAHARRAMSLGSPTLTILAKRARVEWQRPIVAEDARGALAQLDICPKLASDVREMREVLSRLDGSLRRRGVERMLFRQLERDMALLDRAILEGMSVFRLLDGLTSGMLSSETATRALSVLHTASAFHEDALDAITSAERISSALLVSLKHLSTETAPARRTSIFPIRPRP